MKTILVVGIDELGISPDDRRKLIKSGGLSTLPDLLRGEELVAELEECSIVPAINVRNLLLQEDTWVETWPTVSQARRATT